MVQGTPFPFPCPSIVNTFLRRTVFSLIKEIFTMRPKKPTRRIFKTNVSINCRIRIKPKVYKRLPQIKETHFKGRYQQYIKSLLYACVYIQLIPRRRVEKFARIVTGDKKFGMSLNMFSDSAWNEGNIAYTQQCGFHWSNCCEIWKIWRGIPDLVTVGQNYWTRHKINQVRFILASGIKSQWQQFSSANFSQDFRIAKVE
jgi:hypothetical protein